MEALVQSFRNETVGAECVGSRQTAKYISALNFGGKPLQVLELARAGHIENAISNAIITETSRILYTKLYWNPADIADAVDQVLGFSTYVHADYILDVVPSDPDDHRVIECALKARSGTIVTGDTDLLVLGSFRESRS